MTAPCKSCPWRKSSTIGGADIPGFSIELMRSLSNTVGEEDTFRPMMACHGSTEGNDMVCIGYVHVEGYKNLALRMRGTNWNEIAESCKDIELWPSFQEMLSAYEEAANA